MPDDATDPESAQPSVLPMSSSMLTLPVVVLPFAPTEAVDILSNNLYPRDDSQPTLLVGSMLRRFGDQEVLQNLQETTTTFLRWRREDGVHNLSGRFRGHKPRLRAEQKT